MMLPYTAEVYFASIAGYNATWFPVVASGVLLAIIALVLAARPPAGREALCGRLIGTYLAVAALWVGVFHQFQMMATLNFLAPLYGGAWILQGVLVAGTVVLHGGVGFRFGGDARGWFGLILALLGLVLYPLAVLALGYGWRALPLVGTAPDPTAIFTAGLLMAARPRPPLHLLAVPIAWSGVAGVSAHLLEFPLDFTVPLAIGIAFVLAVPTRLRRNR